jgi:hypothetical protein
MLNHSLPLSFLLFLSCASSLDLHYSSKTTSYNSRYTTIGDNPATTITANLTLINNTHVTQRCELEHINTSTAIGTIFVYTDQVLPLLYRCCSDLNGVPAAFARMMERYGALAVVIPSFETVLIISSLFEVFYI